MTKAPQGGLRQESLNLGEEFTGLRRYCSTVLWAVTKAIAIVGFLAIWLSGSLD